MPSLPLSVLDPLYSHLVFWPQREGEDITQNSPPRADFMTRFENIMKKFQGGQIEGRQLGRNSSSMAVHAVNTSTSVM